ncbi:MAG TPA: AMP-dependent synthetase/ligase [Kofleriaceae bacterium]|nr:AMP-dependent synthetase/ligase [Kofleriaceae bacterium]
MEATLSTDLSRFLEVKPAPRAVFDSLGERAGRPRFHVAGPDGRIARSMSWAEHAGEIRRLAAFLIGAGLRPGDRAAILAVNSTAWAAAAMAILSARGVLVPIYPASSAEQIDHVLRSSRARFVFADPDQAERAGAHAGPERVVALDADSYGAALAAGEARLAAEPDLVERTLAGAALDETALLLYTSGTTGLPRGVPLSHRNVGVNGRDWLRCFQELLHEDAIDVLWLPMSHIFGLGELCLGHTLGFETTLVPPAVALDILPRVRPTVFMSVPALWDRLAAPALAAGDPGARRDLLARATGGRLRLCLSGGAGLAREVKEVFHESGILLVEGYGLTECSPTLTLNRPGDFRFDSVGKPLPSVELRLAEDGEIEARGESVFAGYDGDPDATRDAFTDDGWFRTGDIGRMTGDGFLQIVDRKKDILVTAGGKNIPPAAVEARFAGDPLLAHVVVYGDGKRYLVAAVWLSPAAGLAPPAAHALVADRVRAVNQTLARHETIKRFRIMERPLTVESGLLTASLKIRRRAIHQAFREELEALYRDDDAPAP